MLTLSQRRQLLKHCLQSAKSSFYRDLYSTIFTWHERKMSSEKDWQLLPVLTKDDLISRTMEDRSFLSLEELDHVRASSGTSGKAPLFTPRTHVRNMDYRFEYHDFKNAFLSFGVPMMPHWHEMVQKELGITPQVISYDPRSPRVSVQLATLAGVDAASLFLYHIKNAGEEMKKTGLNERILFLEVTGETCSRAVYEYMRETFPNATILQSYGASEVEDVHIGIPCKPMDGTEPIGVYHSKDSHFLEIIDSDGNYAEPKKGVEGDLLITAYPGEPSAFPLIRFKIGDTIRVVEDKCEHDKWSFTVLGRTELDFLKVEGGVLKADEVSRVLSLFPDTLTDAFELHRYEKETPKGPRTYVEVHVETLQSSNFDDLALELSRNIRIGPMRTYLDGVEDGTFLPLVCKNLEEKEAGGKHKRVISHTDE